ncbi:Mitochondrial inner membrane protein OXA1 [Triticum urartu]|uniref:Mitochondrial inner membrane protein OXA1 n=1 Tax=Triticum urartu TaxID=4572 RepID=M7ZVI5_TRIUA|nr:Mitochondrial inner membrane protein OXA1 [Triticum urartu]
MALAPGLDQSKAIKPEMEAIKDAMDSPDPKAALEGKYKMTALFQKHGVSPFSPLKGMLIQGPMFMSFFFAINNMVEKVPSMKAGGVFWFTDLTTPDPLYICPVLAALTFLVTVELNLQEGMEGNSMADKMKTFSRGMALMTVPFTMNFAKGIFCYWVTSNLFSLVYGIVIRRPAVRKLFNLPAWEAPSAPALNSALNMFGGSKAVPSEKSPLALTAAQQSSLEKPDAAALGYRVKNLEKKGKSRGKSRKRSSVPASEEVVDGFLHALAKRTKPTIGPPPVGQIANSTYPILHGQPREKFDLGRAQAFHTASSMGEWTMSKNWAKWVNLAVYISLCVFSHNVVFGVHLKRKVADGGPKLNKLSNMFEGELGSDLDLANPSIISRASRSF